MDYHNRLSDQDWEIRFPVEDPDMHQRDGSPRYLPPDKPPPEMTAGRFLLLLGQMIVSGWCIIDAIVGNYPDNCFVMRLVNCMVAVMLLVAIARSDK